MTCLPANDCDGTDTIEQAKVQYCNKCKNQWMFNRIMNLFKFVFINDIKQ